MALSDFIGVIGSALGLGAQAYYSEKDRKFIEKENQKARDYQTEMWNKANEYNLPINVMERLSQAGLNPNLVYANGAESLASYASAPGHSAPNLNRAQIGRTLAENSIALQQMKSNIEVNDSIAYKNYQEGDKAKQEARSATVKAQVDEDKIDVYRKMIDKNLLKLQEDTSLTVAQKYYIQHLKEDLMNDIAAKNFEYRTESGDQTTYINGYHLQYSKLAQELTNANFTQDQIDNTIKSIQKGIEEADSRIELNQKLGKEAESRTTVNYADAALKQSQQGYYVTLQEVNKSIVKLNDKQRQFITSEISKNNALIKQLKSVVRLNDAQIDKMMNDFDLAVMNGSLDAWNKLYSQKYGTGTVGTILNFLHEGISSFGLGNPETEQFINDYNNKKWQKHGK